MKSLITDFKIKSINWQPFEPSAKKQNSFLLTVFDKIRNRSTASTETAPTHSFTEVATTEITPATSEKTNSEPSKTEPTSECTCSIDPTLRATLNEISNVASANNEKLLSMEPQLTRILEQVTLITSQTSGIDEGFMRFNDHLSNLYEVIKAQSTITDVHLDEMLNDNLEKLQALKRNSTNHRSKIKD